MTMTPAKRGSLLIVDDEFELMSALCKSLAEQDFDVKGFTDPAEALAALPKRGPDILLSDLVMPETDGIQLWRQSLAIDPTWSGSS
jgi:DNA-binding NtrC family response regulator